MSKQVIWSTHGTGKSRQTMQSHQPGWMAHWMRTSSNTTAERRNDGDCGNKEFDCVSRDDHKALEAPRTVKDPGKIEANAESLRVSSKSFGNEGMCSAYTEHGQETGDTQAIRPIIDHNLDCGKTMNYKGGIKLSSGILTINENSSREYRSSIEGISMKSPELVKTQFSAKDGSSSTSMFSRERYVGPSTHVVPYHNLERYKFDKGKAVVFPLISRPSSVVFNNQLPDTKLKIIGQEHGLKHFQWDSEMGNHSELGTSINACFGDRNASFSSDPPSMIDRDQPRYGKDWRQKMQKCSHIISTLPSQFSEKNENKVPCYDHYPLQKFPSCVHETVRICTTVDSVEAPATGCPWFSQTTHSLLIKKNNDVNVSKETDIFRRLITQMNGNSSSDLEYVPPSIGRANRGVIIQPISSSNSEGQGNVENTGIGTSKYASKNESSAETDTMDMDFSNEERPNCGANSTCSTKVFNPDNNPSPRIVVASSREVGRRWMSFELPEINLELPALPAVASSSEDAPTSSRTQSLEMEMLLAQAEQPEPKSNLSPDDYPKPDPTTRWVKRLKLSSPDSSAQGTKSMEFAEKSSHDKRTDFFRSILKKGIAREQSGEEAFLSDRSGSMSREDDQVSPEQPKKSKELLLSHVWIKRWLHDGPQTPQRKPETIVICEPQSLKSSVDDHQKKQFPSIAAMALMGRTMSGFQSCELQKRGSFTIWNTNNF